MPAPTTIIPAVDIMDGKVVRLYRGDPNKKTIYSSDPVATALKWQEQGADRLHIVDLDATLGSGSNYPIVRRIADAVSIPVQVAGGLRTVDAALDAAQIADHIVIGTIAFSDSESLASILDGAGRDKVIVSADHENGTIVVRGWQQQTDLLMKDEIGRMWRDLGVCEFLATSVGRDGTMQGPDTEYLRQACAISGSIRIIASGGISGVHDIPAVAAAGAWGVILGRAMYDGALLIRDAKQAAKLPLSSSSEQQQQQHDTTTAPQTQKEEEAESQRH